MSSTIKIKRSNTSGNAPDTNNIVEGELALNTADGILYSRGGNTIFEVGANLTTPLTVDPSTASDTITLGATAQTGTITLGRSNQDNTINIGNAAMQSTEEQIVNIASGTGSGTHQVNIAACGAQGNDTAVTIGGGDPTFGTTTCSIRGTTTFTLGDANFNGNDFNVIPNGGGDTITIGKSTGTGTITLGNSTDTQTISIGSGNTLVTKSGTVNIGGGMSNGGSKVVNICGTTSNYGTRVVNIGTNTSTNGLSCTTTIGSLHTSALSNNLTLWYYED